MLTRIVEGRGEEELGIRQALHQFHANWQIQFMIAVDQYFDRTASHQLRTCGENDEHQHEDNRCEQAGAEQDFEEY